MADISHNDGKYTVQSTGDMTHSSSGQMSFSDSISGTKTLAELAEGGGGGTSYWTETVQVTTSSTVTGTVDTAVDSFAPGEDGFGKWHIGCVSPDGTRFSEFTVSAAWNDDLGTVSYRVATGEGVGVTGLISFSAVMDAANGNVQLIATTGTEDFNVSTLRYSRTITGA